MTISPEKISNGNEKISSKEWNYLRKLSQNPEYLIKNFGKSDLIKLKRNLTKQMESYQKRKNISLRNKKILEKLTKKSINKINNFLNKESNEEKYLDREFPSIKDVEKFKESILKMKETRDRVKRKLDEIKRNGYSDNVQVTIKYSGIRDKIKVGELKDLLKTLNFNILSDEAGISKGNKKISYSDIGKKTKEYIKEHPKSVEGLRGLFVNAKKYMGVRERGHGHLHDELKRGILKLTGINIDHGGEQAAWCAAFVRYILYKSGYKESAKRMNNGAVSALGLPYQKGHIGIYEGGGKMINGNSANRVRESWVNKNKLIGWVYPEDVGIKSKVHYDKNNIPVGAILVFTRGKNAVARARKFNNGKEYHNTTKYTKKRNRRSSPLDLLRV